MRECRPPFVWNARLERRLRALIGDGMTRAECARALGASERVIARKAMELGLRSGRIDLSSAGTHATMFDFVEMEE